MPKRREKQRKFLEFDKRSHIPLRESNTETEERKSKGRTIPPPIENLLAHSEALVGELEESFEVSRSRRKIYQTDNVYFKIAFTNKVYYNEKDLLKNEIELLIVLDNNKAIVRLPDAQMTELTDKIKHYEELKFKSMLKKLSTIEPLKTDEKIGTSLEDEIKKTTGEDKLIFVEIRLFPNLDMDEYSKILESIKGYIASKREELVSETVEERRAKVRAKIRLSSIRELTEGVEPISLVEKVPRYRIGFSHSREIDHNLKEFQPKPQENCPTICVIDSGVAGDHPLLQGVVDEVVDFSEETRDGYDNDGHGTFVTGLVAYGDSFHSEVHHPDMKVVVAKAMDKDGDRPDLEKILPKVVNRFYRKARVFNMSISKEDYCKPLDTELASIIDKLEREYRVVFCVPTGNIPLNEIQMFINSGEKYPSYLDRSECLLLQPGEACNAITVGSIARSGSLVSLAKKGEPSPFTRRGPTPEMRVKPDFVEFDGNVAAFERSNSIYVDEDVNISTISLNSAFENSYLTTDNGTSFATPLVSRYAAKLMQHFPRASPNLIKALLMNSIIYEQLSRRNKRILGHGRPILENALNSTPFKTTYYLESSVNMKHEKIVRFRVPEKMSRILDRKRICIILVYNPPVDSSKEYYVLTGLDFKLHKGGTGERAFQRQNWVYDSRNNKWDNVKVAIYEWQRMGWGQDWDIHIIPYYPRALEYTEYDQHFALVITLEDITKTVDIHTAILNELGITLRDIERIRIESNHASVLKLLE